jgi:hypothetical protein
MFSVSYRLAWYGFALITKATGSAADSSVPSRAIQPQGLLSSTGRGGNQWELSLE